MERKSWGWYALFGALYFAQGCSGAVTNATLLYVMYKVGWTKGMGGTFLAVAMLPWTWKLFLAPFVDRVKLPGSSLGSKPGWIVISTIAAAACLVALALVGDWFAGVLSLVFLHNVFRSLQDIAVDGWSVEICGRKKSRPVQAAMNVGRALGGLAGGGGAMAFLIVAPWPAVCVIAATVSLGAVIVPLLVLERSGWRPSADVVGGEAAGVKWSDFLRGFWGVGPLALVVAALLIHIPEGITGHVVYSWFIGLGYGDAHISWMMSWVSAAKIGGAVAIGMITVWMAVRRKSAVRPMMVSAADGVRPSRRFDWLLAIAIVAKCCGYIAIGMFSGLWRMDWLVFAMVVYTSCVDVVVVVLFCATAMDVCSKKVAATQFAAYMAVMNVCVVWTSWVGGRFSEAFSGVGLYLLDAYVSYAGVGMWSALRAHVSLLGMFSTAGLFFLSGLAGLVVILPLWFVFRFRSVGELED